MHHNLAGAIQKELWGIQAFAQIAAATDLGFEVPEVIDFNSSILVTKWVEGQTMQDRFKQLSPTFKEDTKFFAESLAKIDIATNFGKSLSTKFNLRTKGNTSGIDRLRRRVESVDTTLRFDRALIDKCFRYLENNATNLIARLTHADFTPSNIIVDNEKKTLLDYESTSFLWPRFYDLVNLTINRMIMEPELTEACVNIIDQYFNFHRNVDPEQVMLQLNTIAMIRLLSMIWENLAGPNEYVGHRASMSSEVIGRLHGAIDHVLSDKLYSDYFRPSFKG